MSLLSTVGSEKCYIVIYPNVAIKNIHVTELLTKEVYQRWPTIDYYKQYSSGVIPRASLGSVKVYTPEELRNNIGIVVVNCRLYPGNKSFPNDNETTRLKYFREAFETLQNDSRINVLHLELPGNNPEYRRIIEDYKTTCMLNHKTSPTVHIHAAEDDRSGGLPMMLEDPIKVDDVKYRLHVNQNQICQAVLYPVDFAHYTVRMANGIMRYFPTDAKWQYILDDAQLCKFAIEIEKQLTPVLDTILPPKELMFNAFKLIEGDIRVIILGQDPYPTMGQAHGLSFSVPHGVTVPRSLDNIYKALSNDVGCTRVDHGCLEEWAHQGVLLLNCSLSVLPKDANCHASIWQGFTDRLIQVISSKCNNIVFMLWGDYAKKKRKLIAGTSHLILEFNHPSPQVPNNPFASQCKHFSQANTFFTNKNLPVIHWQLN